MNTKETRDDQTGRSEGQPYRVRLPGFIADEEVGLGETIKRVTSAFGIRPCEGCERRATTLNHWLVFSGKRTQ